MKYFTIKEMCSSHTAKKLGIDNTPSDEIKDNLTHLIESTLDPIREAFGDPIIISSGYRCPELNKACGGSKTSHHVKGIAADLDTDDNARLWDTIINSGLQWTQLINENPDANGVPSWIHISVDADDLKNETLIYKNNKYTRI
jgi:hypothetical protein